MKEHLIWALPLAVCLLCLVGVMHYSSTHTPIVTDTSYTFLNPGDRLIADETWVAQDSQDTLIFCTNVGNATKLVHAGWKLEQIDGEVMWLVRHQPYHSCVDSTHSTCDGSCLCDGLDCSPLNVEPCLHEQK